MTVVVGYVPGATGVRAVEEAARQARWRGTDVVLVNVVDAAGYARPTAADERDLDAITQRVVLDDVAISVRQVELAAERVSDTLLAVALEVAAELVVLGVRRRSPVAKAVLGSTVQRVLVDAPCPVLTVPPAGD